MFKQLLRRIEKNKNIFIIISLLAVIFWYLNFSTNRQGPALSGWFYFLNIFCFLVYFFLNSFWLGKILRRYGWERELYFIFGAFCLLFLIAFGMAVPIVIYRVTPVYLLIWLLLLTGLISFVLEKTNKKPTVNKEMKKTGNRFAFKPLYLLLFVLLAGCLFFLFYSRTGEYVDSPWKIIHPLYLYAWLGVIFILGWLAFTKIKIKHFLFLVILASLVFHAYLIIPYKAGFGGDKWRHIGAEQWLAEGKIYEPVLLGKNVSRIPLGPFQVPEVLVAGNKTSYANMWGLTIALSWLTGINIFYLDLILGFLLFSIFLPFLLLKLGLFFSQKKEFLFLLMLMPFCFYPFQVYGSITVPMTFSFLPFLFSLIFIAQYLKQKEHSKKLFWFLVLFIPFLYFGYLVYLILFLEMFVLAILIKNMKENKKVSIPLLVFFFLILLLLIPGMETYNQYSWLKNETPVKIHVGEMFRNFPLKLIISQPVFPRVYGFEQDNWLYAMTDRELSRSALLDLLPWVLILTPLVWLFTVFGFWRFRKSRTPGLGLLFFFILAVVLVNQMISSYLMDGNHLLTKRLVMFTSFMFFMPLCWGVCCFKEKIRRKFSSSLVLFFLAIFISLLSVTVYASGPRFQVVTQDEYQAAQYLWQNMEKLPQGKYCVLANTWPLLALEGVSGRQIVTGGFPYYYEYRQPERTQLFENMNSNPSVRYLEKSLEITGADECYFMTEERWVYFDKREQIIEQLDEILGQHESLGKVMIWKYKP